MNSISSSITSGVIRFCRPLSITEIGEDIALVPGNLGGIVFAIDIHHDAQQLHVGYSICRFDENFNKSYGTFLALKKLKEGNGIVVPYNKEISLLENIIHAVDPESEDGMTHSSNDGDLKRFQTLQRALYTTLNYSDYVFEEYTKMYEEQNQTIH